MYACLPTLQQERARELLMIINDHVDILKDLFIPWDSRLGHYSVESCFHQHPHVISLPHKPVVHSSK